MIGQFFLRYLLLVVSSLLLTACIGNSPQKSASAPFVIESKEVSYSSGQTALTGHLSYPLGQEKKLPAIMVVHEWYGLNNYAKKRAEELAKLGHVTLAIDMYGKGKNTGHPAQAKEFMMAALADKKEGQARFMAAVKFLQELPQVDAQQMASVGYCFGGGVNMFMARQGVPLKGIAIFHGSLATPENKMQKGVFNGKIFVATGGADPMVPADQVAQFAQEMQLAEVEYQLAVFPGALHAFTNPAATKMGQQYSLPLAYDSAADQASWKMLGLWLKDLFATSSP